jgi:hypothetical protein
MKTSVLVPFKLQICFIAVAVLTASTGKAASTLTNEGASIARSVDSADRAEILVRVDLKTGFREVVIVQDSLWIRAFATHLTSGVRDTNALGTVIGSPQIEFFVNGKRLVSFAKFGDNAWWVSEQSGTVLTLSKADLAALNSMLNDAKPRS